MVNIPFCWKESLNCTKRKRPAPNLIPKTENDIFCFLDCPYRFSPLSFLVVTQLTQIFQRAWSFWCSWYVNNSLKMKCNHFRNRIYDFISRLPLIFSFVCEDISNTREGVFSNGPRRSQKIIHCASYFPLSSRCLEMKRSLSRSIYYEIPVPQRANTIPTPCLKDMQMRFEEQKLI